MMNIKKRVENLEGATQKPDQEGFPRKVKYIRMDKDGNIITGVEELTEEEYNKQNPKDQSIWVNWDIADNKQIYQSQKPQDCGQSKGEERPK